MILIRISLMINEAEHLKKKTYLLYICMSSFEIYILSNIDVSVNNV